MPVYPHVINDWKVVQDTVWPNAAPLPENWIRVWSVHLDREYYCNVLTNATTFQSDGSNAQVARS